MTHTPSVRPKVATARAVVSGACAAAACGGIIAFTATTRYPLSLDAPSSIFVIAAIWFGTAIILSAASAAALRYAGRTWGSALSADALTYLPLLLLWAVIILPVAERAAFRLFWAAVAAVGVG
ncbi:MAG: hypothetical protein JSV65_17675, partial [Armatimonadota bacterium]